MKPLEYSKSTFAIKKKRKKKIGLLLGIKFTFGTVAQIDSDI
jgi:hypothetical protein